MMKTIFALADISNVCILARSYNDVLELMWFYETTFASDFYKSKDDLIKTVKKDLDDNINNRISFSTNILA